MYVYMCISVYIFIYPVPTSQRTQFLYKDKSVHDVRNTRIIAAYCDNHTNPMPAILYVSRTQRCLM